MTMYSGRLDVAEEIEAAHELCKDAAYAAFPELERLTRHTHGEIEEMGRTGDARVVVANRLLALPGQVLIIEIQPAGDEPAPHRLAHEPPGPRARSRSAR